MKSHETSARQWAHSVLAAATLAIAGVASATAQEPNILVADEQSRELEAPARGVLRERSVRVDADALSEVEDKLRLELFHDLAATVVITSRQNVHHGWSWIGKIEGKGTDAGWAHLLVTDGQLHGELAWSGRVVRLELGAKGRVRVREIDPASLPGVCGLDGSSSASAPKSPHHAAAAAPHPSASSEAPTGAEIDVLVLYTPAAVAVQGEAVLLANIESAVEHFTNNAFATSGVHHRVRLVDIQLIDYQEVGDDVGGVDLQRMRNHADGHMDDIPERRAATGADLVLLVVQGINEYPLIWCGLGFLGAPLDAENAYSVVERGCLGGRTAAHELGHNLGLNHDWPDDALHEFSHGFRNAFVHTIMSYGHQDPPTQLLLRFSNPNHYWWVDWPPGSEEGTWFPLGNPERADAVRSINLAGGTVASYRHPPEDVIPEPPTELEPREDEENPPIFQWTGSVHAADHRLVVRDVAGGPPVINRIVSGSTWQPNPERFTVGHSYEFSLRGRSRLTQTEGEESERVRLDIVAPCTVPVTAQPVLHGPSGCVGSLQPIFSWTSPAHATWSRLTLIEIDPASTTDVIKFEDDVDGESWQPSFALTPGVTYRFKVKGKNRCTPLGGPYSASMHFTPECPLPPSITIVDEIRSEGDVTAQFPVRLSYASQQPVTVRYATSEGSARAGSDFTPATGELVIPPGATQREVVVSLHDDAVIEPPESFTVQLSQPSNAVLEDATAVGWVIDDDALDLATVAVYCPHELVFRLRYTNSMGYVDAIRYGIAGDQPLLGDWNGDGVDTIGMFRPSTGYYYLRNSNTTGVHDVTPFLYGSPGDIRLSGDWDGDGVDTIGVYRPAKMMFFLRNSNTTGNGEIEVQFGAPGDIPIVGDWNGDGIDTIGVYRPSTQRFYLRNFNTAGPPDVEAHYGGAGDLPVLADWDGDGDATLGIFRPSNAHFYLRNSNTTGIADFPPLPLGHPDDVPLAGVFRNQH